MAPISKNHIEKVEKNMIERGVLNEDDPCEERRQRTIKSVLKSWAAKYLKITEQEWKSIHIEEITQTYTEDSDILFLCCKSPDDASKITSKARNLPPDPTGQGPRLVMYIDKRACAQYRAFQNVAKTLRDEATQNDRRIQTNLRTGRTDFLLRIRQAGDPTNWSDIAPLRIEQKLPQFEIGLYKDVFNCTPSSSESEGEEEMESQEDKDELDTIEKDLQENDKKKDRVSSDEEDKTGRRTRIRGTPHPRGKNQPPLPSDSSDDEKSSQQEATTPRQQSNNTRRSSTPSTPCNLDKAILAPDTPTNWNDMSESQFNPKITETVADTPAQTKNKKSSTRMEYE